MKNFAEINRASIGAKKNFNLIEWLQTDSHGKQSATRDHHGTKSRELPDNPRLYRYPCATLALPLRYVAMIFAVLVMSMANIGMAWGADFTPTQIASGANSGNISVSTSFSKSTGKKFCTSETSSDAISVNNSASGNYNTYYIEIKADEGYTISSLSLKVAANGTTAGTEAIAFWSGVASNYCTSVSTFTAQSNGGSGCNNTSITVPANTRTIRLYRKLCVGNDMEIRSSSKTDYGGSTTYNVFGITATASGSSTKRIYMKCGNSWCNDNPKFYAHSWGSSDNDVELTLADCETDVYYADIPSGNTSVVFTRQSPSSTGIAWSGSNFWNQSEDITISTNDKFTCTGWNNGKGTFSGSTYSAPTYTITYAAGGGTGSMTATSGIACGADQALPANTFTKSGYVFDGWKANVAVTIGGSSVAANTKFAGGSTLQNITSNITLTAQWAESSCPDDGTVYSAAVKSTVSSNQSFSANSTTEVNASTQADITGGKLYAINGESSAKDMIKSSSGYKFCMPNNSTRFKIEMDCALQEGDVITIDGVGGTKNSDPIGLWVSSSESRPGSAPACSGTSTTESLVDDMVNYTVTSSDEYHGKTILYIHRAVGTSTYFNNINITRTSSCGATQPGAISKGSLSSCSLPLTASGSPVSNNTWYWQSAANGTDKTGTSGATKSVNTPGTYYIRSYYSTGDCWSDAQSVEVTASDLTPAAPTALAKSSETAKGATLTVTDAANTNDYEFYVSTSSSTPGDGTSASYTSTSKSITITDKYAGTTFYAWARAKCGSYKSAWTALTGNTFTTSQVTVTHTLTNVTATSGATGANAAGGSDYTAVFAAVSGYSLPAPAITIDGNAAESGTDYTWTQGTGTVVIPANKITGNIVITIASAAAAPSSVAIGDNWLWFAGETMTLTATPTGGNGPITYQWYKGGKADGNAIDGATNATFSKTCAFEDAGSYYCKVTCGGSESTWGQNGDAYEVKVPHLYVKTGRNDGVKSDFGDVDFTRVDASTATASMTLGANWDYCYNIADGCGHYYGNAGTMQYNNYGPWVTNVNNQDCGLHTTNGATYVFTINYSNWTQLTTTVTFPSSDQAAGKVIYFDNYDRQWTNVYYRIGHSTHVQAAAMTKVYGTANLYKYTTTEYNGFAGWHITNATGETGSNKNIYNTVNSPAISEATAHEGGAVTQEVVTVTPTTSRGNGADVGVNNNCEFFNYDITSGMKTDNVSITAPSNGTITVSYTDVNNAAQSFTSGNRDLAHTVIITPMAAPSTGYDLSTLTVNGSAHPNNTTYTCSGATVVAATFSLHNYNVTYSAPGNGNNYTIKVADGSATSASKTATMGQTITIVATPATGYDFTGWTISKAGGGTVTPADASATTTTFTMPTDNVTITASFTLKTYTVTYNAGSGAGISGSHANDTKTYGVNLTLPGVTFTRTGYTQTGWATSDGGSQAYALSGSYTTNAAANLYPAWTAKTTTITINANTANHGSTTPGTVTATWGSALPSFTAAAGESGYSLTGYYTAATGGTKIINADGTLVRNTTYATDESTPVWKSEGATLTLYAQYESVFTVSFNSNGGSAVSPITQASEGASITMPAAPTYADHTFQGWVIGGNTYAAGASYTPTANVTAYATWKADCAGGTTEVYNGENVAKGNTTASGWTIYNSSSMTLTSGSSNGYSYWYQAGSSTSYVQFNGSIAVESGDQIKIKWTHTNGTSKNLALTINGSSASLTSGGSASSSTLVEAVYDVTSTTTVTSIKLNSSGSSGCIIYQVTVIKGSGSCYYVTYDGNGAESGSVSDATAYASGADVTVLGNTGGNAFVKSGYEFNGWNTLANGTGTPYAAGGTINDISGNVTLFAQWRTPCTDPDAPTALAVGSITSGGATFTITDGANTNNYEIVCKTTSGTPAADATPTETGTSKTIAVTGLNAYTDYYAYVRAVCNASHKSSWVALTGAPFKTLCEDPTTAFANGEYTIGGSALDLRTLISSNNSSGAITYTITNANGTGATIAGDGYSFSATIPGTASVRASQAANGGHCAVVLDATVTVAAASTCVTITNFETTKHNKSNNNKPDGQNYYLYGYKTTVDSEHAVTLTTTSSNNYGQSSGTVIRVDNSSTLRIYANNATSETPTTFSDVTSVSFKADLYNSGSTVRTTSYTIKVGSTTVGSGEITGKHSDGFFEISTGTFATKDGYIDIILGSGNSNNNLYIDDIEICTSALTPCTTPDIPSLSDQTVCPGSDIAAWDATVSNAAAISAAGESVAYSWKKKGSDTELVNTASLDLGSSATEGQSGTYVVTVTVSAAGKASVTASAEVDLAVTAAVEEPSITANKATVYPGNSVTLTATCGTAGVTWNWYLCANADGTGAGSSLGTASTYTIASAPSAGTYYYKATASTSGTCASSASAVYTLVVTAASECEKYFWFVYAADATSNGVINNRDNFFGSSPKTGSSNSSSYKFTLDGTEYTATRNTGDNTFSISFTVPEGSTATLALNCKGSSSKPIYLIPTSGDPVLITDNSSNAAHVVENIAAGTYKVGAKTDASASWTLAGMAVQVCTASTCTDATPTITAANTTVCVGSELSISATGYETGATFQWQKLNSSTSTWDNISGATSATYTVASAAAANAGSYRVIATKGCARTSNTVTIAVPSVPVFGAVPSSVTVMQTIALSITTVEASDAVKYRWYKSADATWDAGDAEICDTKNLLKAYDGEAVGNNAYYVFCRAQNACGITTSTAIAVNVTDYVEEDCATRGGEGEAQFGFENTSCSSGTYSETAVWTTNSRNKYLTYTAPDGKYFKTAKLTVAVTSGSKCGYAYSTDGGTTWTYAELASLSSTLTEKTINLNSLSGTINAFRISRNLQDGGGTDHGVTSGNFHLSKACFEYTNACTATTVTVSPTSKTYTIGNSWTAPTITLGPVAVASETLTYTSSDEDIATVDDDGTVNFQGIAGTVTITASYAGGEVGLTDYCASEGSYTITVSCSDGAPKIFAASSVNLSGCNTSVTLEAKQSSGTAFSDGTYQWYLDGEPISGATLASYTAVQAGVYTVERTGAGGCTNLSSNSATVTSETTEPEVERLVPFQYYHVNKTYSDQMKMRHLFAVKNSGTLDGKSFKMFVSRNSGEATDVTSSNALVVWPNGDGHVDTVMVDLNKLSGKYSENDELVFTCKAIDCSGNVSDVYKETITMRVIGATPTLALILNGKGSVVGGDFLEDYEPKNLQEQTGSKTWGGEWPMYTDLKTEYNVTPVNGYAPFNKLNYEPFDIIFLTDFPKASKSDATKHLLDDMYELVDFRPMFSFKTHMLWVHPSKWASKGFTAEPVVPKGGDGRTNMNIVCYAHPMFESIKTGEHVYNDASDATQIVYKMLSDVGYENSKGIQGFEIDAAENFVTIGLIHHNATATPDSPTEGEISWSSNSGDRMLVATAERQANPEARMILFSLNAGAHSKLTAKGRAVVMKSLEYLIQTSSGLIEPADCSFTFDNATGDHNWNTAGNWGPDHNAVPGQFTSTRIAAAAVVNIEHAHAMEVRIVEGGSIEIPAGKGLEVKSTVRHMDGAEISPTEVAELSIGSASSGNGTLIFNNKTGDTKAGVAMYSKGYIDGSGNKNYQYMGTPFNEVNALYNYYGSWIYSWSDKGSGYGWKKVPNGGTMYAWTGYCITQETATTHWSTGTLAATGTVDIPVPAGENMVVGNSWTAPISIGAFADDDFENLTKSVYFFNTGVDKDYTTDHPDHTETADKYAPSTYVTVPIHAADYTGTSDHIPSLQGFFVKNTSESAGVLHLDYDRHVRGTTRANILSGEMHAPKRAQTIDTDEPVVLKIKVSGENYDDKLVLLGREDFSEGFDNGWDGDKWDGNESALYLYTTDSEGTENSVSAVPELEGTVIGFRAGEDDEYTMYFDYLNGDEKLYLWDTETGDYTVIKTGYAYAFTTADKEKHARFIITRSNGEEISTGVEPTSDSSLKGRAKKLLIDNKMYILVNGMLFDATGKVVK